jgi:HEAT repeats
MLKPIIAIVLASQAAVGLNAQSLAQRIDAVANGTVRMSFAAREGVCSSSGNNISFGGRSDEWQPDCGPRLVRVALHLEDRRVQSSRAYVGGRWAPDPRVVDLGTVSSPEAGRYFIELAQKPDAGASDEDLLLPAVLADSITIWPSLLKIARSPGASEQLRKRAVFWLGQAASEAAGLALDSIASDDRGDREVRKQAIFALSQRSTNEGVPALIRIARSNPDPELRKTALFWLGQSEDPRAIGLFEEILGPP